MKYLLDTNICIHFFKGKFGVDKKIESIGIDQCAISEITLAELVYGAENSHDPAHNLKIVSRFADQLLVLPILSAIAQYGKQKTRLRRNGIMISDFDLLIGCTAVENNMVMITENTREFDRIEGLHLENWIVR